MSKVVRICKLALPGLGAFVIFYGVSIIFHSKSSKHQTNPYLQNPPQVNIGDSSTTLKGHLPNPPPSPKPELLILSSTTIRPYQLWLNPYLANNQLVTLIPYAYPVLMNNALLAWQGRDRIAILAAGLTGLQFHTMLAPDLAIYNVMAQNESMPSEQPEPAVDRSGISQIGQMAIKLDHVDYRSGTTLDGTKMWAVVPMGVLRGTNEYGAEIQIPEVKFYGYVNHTPENNTNVTRIYFNNKMIPGVDYSIVDKETALAVKWNAEVTQEDKEAELNAPSELEAEITQADADKARLEAAKTRLQAEIAAGGVETPTEAAQAASIEEKLQTTLRKIAVDADLLQAAQSKLAKKN